MKKSMVRSLLAVSFVAVLGVAPQIVFAQAEGEPGQVQQEAAQQPVEPITGLELEGQIRSVGLEERIVLLTSRDGVEVLFHYDDQTEVAGEIDGVQGLSGESGAWARITYRAEGNRAIAERIELIAAPADAAGPENPAAEPEAGPAPEL